MGRRIRTVLIGAGRMGRNHLRTLMEDSRFELVAIVDPQETSNASIPSFVSLDVFLEQKQSVDFCIVASPTDTHFSLASRLMSLGVPSLIEKPVCRSSSEASQLLKLNLSTKTPIFVGHLERLNPAVQKLKEVIEAGWIGKPIHFNFTRVGGYPDLDSNNTNVILDLAVHDVDVFRFLCGESEIVSSFSHQAWRSGIIDTSEIVLESESGATASIHTNWITPTKIRTIRVTGTRAVCFVDYILQTCELSGGNFLNQPARQFSRFEEHLEHYREKDRVEFGIRKEEPLKVQLDQIYKFFSKQPFDLCSVDDAARAVYLAEKAVSEARMAREARPSRVRFQQSKTRDQ